MRPYCNTAQNAEQSGIEHIEVIGLSLDDTECFAQLVLKPQQPGLALERAFSRRRKLLRIEAESLHRISSSGSP